MANRVKNFDVKEVADGRTDAGANDVNDETASNLETERNQPIAVLRLREKKVLEKKRKQRQAAL